MTHWYVGWDSREQEAYTVATYSLLRCSSPEIHITPLKHRALRKDRVFWREWKIDGKGQFWDLGDGRPFSTEFSHSRFLVPHLARQNGIQDWVFFVDPDFLFLNDTAELEKHLDRSKAVMCVQHDYRPSGSSKMDGMAQTSYSRKNWSSLMAFNLSHEALNKLTPELVNTADGSVLHKFEWLDDKDLGALPLSWNFLVGESPDTIEPDALHFTNGGPWFDDWTGGPYDHLWTAELNRSRHASPTTYDKLLEAFA